MSERKPVLVWYCGDGVEPLDVAWGRMLAEEYLREWELSEDTRHAEHPDQEMCYERATVDPWAPSAPTEVQFPDVIDAAVWESLR